MAVRQSDRIDPDEQKRAKNPRKGRQMLSGSALLRLAFGLRLFDTVKKRGRKRGRYDQKNPQGMSAQACAEIFSASHAHVQNCRNAVSAWIIERQEEVANLALGGCRRQGVPLAHMSCIFDLQDLLPTCYPLDIHSQLICYPLVIHVHLICYPLVTHLVPTCHSFVTHLLPTCHPLVIHLSPTCDPPLVAHMSLTCHPLFIHLPFTCQPVSIQNLQPVHHMRQLQLTCTA